MNRLFQLVLFLLAGAVSASAADLAILRNGNSIRHERREVVGSVTRLYLSGASSGYIEIPSDQIERFEKDTTPPAPVMVAPSTPRASQQPVLTPQRQETLTREGLDQVVSGAGERHQIDPDFINSVIRAESGFHQNAVSKKGAQGLMQLMPGTASQLGVSNTFDPSANVEGGTKYLRQLLEKYNYDVPKALAAYNAGSKRVDQYHGIPPYYETQAYVARIIRDFNRKKLAENPALAWKDKAGARVSAKTARRQVSDRQRSTGLRKTSQSNSGATRSEKPRGLAGSPVHPQSLSRAGEPPAPQAPAPQPPAPQQRPPKAALADSVAQRSQTASR